MLVVYWGRDRLNPAAANVGIVMSLRSTVIASVILAAVSVPALAQSPAPAPKEAGNVVAVDGPAGAVMVFRGAKAYALLKNDVLFEGDRVFTRPNGEADLTSSGCKQHLGKASSIIIDAKFCKTIPISLGDTGTKLAVTGLAAGATAEAVSSSSPNLLALLGTVGVGVAGTAKLLDVDGGGGGGAQ
jgi:hypothetical protein